jgi:hypothetical protein
VKEPTNKKKPSDTSNDQFTDLVLSFKARTNQKKSTREKTKIKPTGCANDKVRGAPNELQEKMPRFTASPQLTGSLHI